MHIEGTYTLLAPPERVWHGMRDQHILLHAVPGLTQIEALNEHTFALLLTMNQEPFIGDCQAELTITEQQFPYHYRLALQGTNDQGQFRGEVTIHLQDRDQSTVVAYTGTVHLDASGELPSITLARGATKLLIQQFFIALDNQLQVHAALDADLAAVVERYDVYNTAVGSKKQHGRILQRDTSSPVTTVSAQARSVTDSTQQRGLFPTLVHLLRLGNGEPEQELIWTHRLRRASTIVSLLFLVWLGTRLPRPRARSARRPLNIHN
jgi:carbon monoxide dehydrogenase subunit G